MEKPLDEVRGRLMFAAIKARAALKAEFPELSDWKAEGLDQDFRMRFRGLSGTSRVTAAEYVNGKVVFK